MKSNVRFGKALVILNGLVPGAILAWDAAHHRLGVNGVNYALHTTGLLALIFLLLSLLVTPLRRLTGWGSIVAPRRALGLYGFFYAVCHFAIFYGFDRALSIGSTLHEILTRRYLQIGTAALLLMVPLAITSTNAMVSRLGPKRWKALHRLSYVVSIAGATHYYLQVKSDTRQPLVFASVLTLFLGYRVIQGVLARKPAGTNLMARAQVPVSKPRFWSGELRVARIFQETHDVRTFRLTNPAGGELPFVHKAGQYLNLALTIDGTKVNRSYTIASSPTQPHYCEITVKKSSMGYASRHLHESVIEGSLLKVSAPAGRFVFTGEAKGVVLLGGGVGITPLMSILRYLTDRCWEGSIYFVLSVRTKADLIFHDELSYLQHRFPNLRYVPTLSKEGRSDWAGERGAITKELLARFIPDLKETPVYLCGPDGMMAAMRRLLNELGIADSRVKTEVFVSPAGATSSNGTVEMDLGSEPELPMTEGEGTVAQVQFKRSGQSVDLTPDQTVLEAAEAAGVEIPFDCRSGICGQCEVRLVSGRVTMETQDALTAQDKMRRLILACQARASGPVAVDA